MSARPGRRVALFGAGRIGRLIARDLAAAAIEVTAIDRDSSSLAAIEATPGCRARRLDLADRAAASETAREHDLAVLAVPGAMSDALLAALAATGRPVVDLSFSPEDPFRHDQLARASGSTVVVDCGVAPGISNWLAGRSCAALERVEAVTILVGGLPERRVWPWEYRSVFSPTDVIEEYMRPSRLRRAGREIVVPALSGLELVDLPRVGTLEAFHTDGLRTLLRTLDAPDLCEKTLRYPGHAERVRALRETGFFSETPIEVGAVSVAPRALTEALLFRAWEREADDPEFTVLRVTVEGTGSRGRCRHVWDLYDRTDLASGASSMARTTGFPAALVARALVEGRLAARPGVHPPERLGRDEALTGWLLDELRARGVTLERRVEPLA